MEIQSKHSIEEKKQEYIEKEKEYWSTLHTRKKLEYITYKRNTRVHCKEKVYRSTLHRWEILEYITKKRNTEVQYIEEKC